ncbi:phosphate signaling complex protein PhoU [Pseudonocardia ailaonensis]|uniref:Phosphate signaling complex protein PhoU n=1 Tax=Pseudonocardia ailaonensis TaxID=367279 RepID=A0ABN2MUJ2_9PSEU
MRRETLDENIAQLQSLLGELADAAAVACRSASTGLLEGNTRLAEQVVGRTPAIDERRAAIELLAVETIGIFAPVGPDMRAVVWAFQSAHELARVNDLARHVAESSLRHGPRSAVPEVAHDPVVAIADAAAAMMGKVAEVLRTRNVILALELATDDDRVDELHRDLFALMFGERWTCGIPAAVDLTLLARFYERIADHAVALAERTVFMVTGQHPEALQV